MNWDYAKAWIEIANDTKEEYYEPKWKFDCGFKLDFDGALLSISSRFYPPHKNDSEFWEGDLHVILFGEKILTKEFKNKDLDQLKNEVENFVEHYKKIIKSRLVL